MAGELVGISKISAALFARLCTIREAVRETKLLTAARQLTAAWKEDYTYHRPHSSLRHLTPAEFAARCAASAPKLASATSQPTSPLQQHSGLTQPILS